MPQSRVSFWCLFMRAITAPSGAKPLMRDCRIEWSATLEARLICPCHTPSLCAPRPFGKFPAPLGTVRTHDFPAHVRHLEGVMALRARPGDQRQIHSLSADKTPPSISRRHLRGHSPPRLRCSGLTNPAAISPIRSYRGGILRTTPKTASHLLVLPGSVRSQPRFVGTGLAAKPCPIAIWKFTPTPHAIARRTAGRLLCPPPPRPIALVFALIGHFRA